MSKQDRDKKEKREKGPSRKWVKVRSRQFAKEFQAHTNMCKYTQYQDVTPSNPPEWQKLKWVVGLEAGGKVTREIS